MADKLRENVLVSGLTDVGRRRDHNEDVFSIEKDLGLVCVADGMGGHEAGEVASAMAVETVADFIYESDPELIKVPDNVVMEDYPPLRQHMQTAAAAVLNANRRICDENSNRGLSEGRGMGTTIVGMWFVDDQSRAILFHVGDSRIYRIRDKKLTRLTRDHSLYEEWVKRGGGGEPPKTNIILKALGPYEEVEPEVATTEYQQGDTFLLCSDGLSDMLTDEDIEARMKDITAENTDEICTKLVESANERGGRDNITVALVTVV